MWKPQAVTTPWLKVMVELTRRLRVLDGADHSADLKVAFASSDRKHVNQHFGSTSCLVIYAVSMDQASLISVSEFGDFKDSSEDKLPIKLQALKGCIAVYCRACGASALTQLLEQGVQPVKVSDEAIIAELLEALQMELREGPSNWLARAIQLQEDVDPERFGSMASEGWEK